MNRASTRSIPNYISCILSYTRYIPKVSETVSLNLITVINGRSYNFALDRQLYLRQRKTCMLMKQISNTTKNHWNYTVWRKKYNTRNFLTRRKVRTVVFHRKGNFYSYQGPSSPILNSEMTLRPDRSEKGKNLARKRRMRPQKTVFWVRESRRSRSLQIRSRLFLHTLLNIGSRHTATWTS